MLSAFIHFFAAFNPIVFSLALFAGFLITLRRPLGIPAGRAPLGRNARQSGRPRRP